MSAESQIGVTGLAVMGANPARNIGRNGWSVAVHNRSPEKTHHFMEEYAGEGDFTGTETSEEFVAALARPRKIIIMDKAGAPLEAVIGQLAAVLDEGDILLDAGDEHFPETQRRTAELEERGLRFLGIGVSGGEEGALLGPSIMPGGTREAYAELEEIFTKIAAQVDGTPCCTFVGTDGAGHYVKMVHNGIEYADIQLITEAYDLMRHVAGLEVAEIAKTFEEWNEGDLESFLIEITAKVLAKQDPQGDGPLIDKIVDQAEQKGTGRWTSEDALEQGVPLTAITEAVFARTLSSLRDERAAASKVLAGPEPAQTEDRRELIDDIQAALYASKVVAYAQGFQQMAAASKREGWDLDLGAMATIWRGGCIIRAHFLNRIKEAYDEGEVVNLLTVPYFRDAVASGEQAWRRVINAAVEQGVAVPAFTSSLAYYDGYRREHGPAGLIQGLRDYFGAHTYHRTDAEGSYHVRWPQDGKEVRTDVQSDDQHPAGR